VTRIAALTLVLVLVAACEGNSPFQSQTSVPTAASRPSSPAVVAIVQPASGAKLASGRIHIAMTLTGARIVPATTTTLTPTEGHVHLYVNGAVVSMNYGLEQDISLTAGTYVMKAEFVAADHAPFNPRVWSSDVFFTVR
jgi:hypothetical protein